MEMDFFVCGLNQQAVLFYNLTPEEIILLQWFIKFKGNLIYKTITIDKEQFYWVNYKTVFECLPCLGYNPNQAKVKIAHVFKSMVDKKVLSFHLLKGTNPLTKQKGIFTLYHLNYEAELFLTRDPRVARGSLEINDRNPYENETSELLAIDLPFDELLLMGCTENNRPFNKILSNPFNKILSNKDLSTKIKEEDVTKNLEQKKDLNCILSEQVQKVESSNSSNYLPDNNELNSNWQEQASYQNNQIQQAKPNPTASHCCNTIPTGTSQDTMAANKVLQRETLLPQREEDKKLADHSLSANLSNHKCNNKKRITETDDVKKDKIFDTKYGNIKEDAVSFVKWFCKINNQDMSDKTMIKNWEIGYAKIVKTICKGDYIDFKKELARLVEWCAENEFWSKQVRSPNKFHIRDSKNTGMLWYDRLKQEMKNKKDRDKKLEKKEKELEDDICKYL